MISVVWVRNALATQRRCGVGAAHVDTDRPDLDGYVADTMADGLAGLAN